MASKEMPLGFEGNASWLRRKCPLASKEMPLGFKHPRQLLFPSRFAIGSAGCLCFVFSLGYVPEFSSLALLLMFSNVLALENKLEIPNSDSRHELRNSVDFDRSLSAENSSSSVAILNAYKDSRFTNRRVLSSRACNLRDPLLL